tara:strand:- start:3110 stop:3787 length:678 start_codon:yes stop_codon:yes gene_type:complete
MNTFINHIGILGLGSRSTLFYIKELHKKIHLLLGDYHTFPCLVYNIDFNTINPYLPNQFDKLVPKLKEYLDQLFKLKITVCIIPNITLHETYDFGNLNHNILHPIQLVIEFLKANKINQIIVFGSKYTMTSNYLKTSLNKHDIRVDIPNKEDIETIDLIRKKLYSYSETPSDIEQYDTLISKYSINTHVLIACTELSILHHEIKLSSNVIDCAFLQIEKTLTLPI